MFPEVTALMILPILKETIADPYFDIVEVRCCARTFRLHRQSPGDDFTATQAPKLQIDVFTARFNFLLGSFPNTFSKSRLVC